MRELEASRVISYLGVPLLQVVPLVGVVRVEPGRLLLLPLHESLQLELLLPLEIKCLRLLLLLHLLLLTQVNSLGRVLVTNLMRGIFEVWEHLWVSGWLESPVSYLHLFHEALDFVHHLVSVRLVDVGAEADLAVPALRYWCHTKHFAGCHWVLSQGEDCCHQLSLGGWKEPSVSSAI